MSGDHRVFAARLFTFVFSLFHQAGDPRCWPAFAGWTPPWV